MSPLMVVAIGIALLPALAGLGWGLARVVEAMGAAWNIATVGSTNVPTAIAVLGTVLLVAGGASVGYWAAIQITKDAEENPYRWTLPLLGVFAGLLGNLVGEYVFENPVERMTFSVSTGLAVVVAGALYRRSERAWKVAAVGLYLLPALFIVALNFTDVRSGLREAWSDASATAFLGLAGLGIVAVLIALIEKKSRPVEGSG